jgi:nicotinate-nucleotide--dimethylbenzimidazole phosphoribosyltransferase
MADLLSLGSDVEWPDHEAATVVRERMAGVPGYGRLADLAEWVAAVHLPEGDFTRVRGVVLGTATTVDLGELVGAQLVEAGELPGDMRAAFDHGVQLVDDQVDSGADLLLLAVPGLGADACIAASVLAATEPVKVLSRGPAATAPEQWMELAVTVRDGRRRCLNLRDKPDDLLDALGSARLAVAAGICMRAAVRRTPLVLDGPSASIGALVAYEAAPRAVRWWRAADQGSDPVHELVLTRLGQQPLVGLETGLGDGLAALLAVPVLRAAVRLAAGS